MPWNMYTAAELKKRGVLRVEDGNHGEYRPRAHEFTATGTSFIRAADLQGNAVDFNTASHISDVALKRIRKGIGEPLDTLITHKGTIGRVAMAPLNCPEYVCSPQTTFWRSTDPAVLLPIFLYVILRSPAFQWQFDRIAHQSDMAGYASLTDQLTLRIPLPPLSDQKAIAEVLGALDDKIAANRKLITTIDELASAEYKKSAVTERTLTDLASFVNGRNFTKNATGDGRVVVRIAELNSGIGGSTVRNRVEDAADEHLVRPGDILFAWSGSLTVHRWTQPEALINQHIFKVIPNSDVPYWLAYQAVKEKLPAFKSIAADKATTMGHIQRRHLDTAVMVPSPEKISEIDPLMSSLWKRAITAAEESQTLASLRDTLLPALMDGTIRVKDAETHVEEVL